MLAPVQTGDRLLIAYATAPGQVALNGPAGGNSPYAEALVRYLDEPGSEIGVLLPRSTRRSAHGRHGRCRGPRRRSPATRWCSIPDPGAELTGRDCRAKSCAGRRSDPSRQRLALSRFLETEAGTPAAELASAYLAELQTTAAAVAIADPVSPETTLAAWQRVNRMASTVAGVFAGELFASLHGSAPSAIGTRLVGPAAGSVVGAEAAELLWPLVQASGRSGDFERYLDLFPDGPRSEAAATAFELASLPLATGLAAAGADTTALVTRRLPVVVGTGPVTLPLPASDRPVVVVDPPRHGRLRAFDAAGNELPLGDQPVQVATLHYEPPLVMRTGVDRLSLAASTPAASEAGKSRSLDPANDLAALLPGLRRLPARIAWRP